MATDPVIPNVQLPDEFCESYPLPLVGGCGEISSPTPSELNAFETTAFDSDAFE